MSPEQGIAVDFMFSTWGREYAQECERYLMDIPVIRYAEGVVASNYMSKPGGRPSGIPEDVWATMDCSFRDRVVERVTSEHYDIIQIEHSQLAWLTPILRKVSPDSRFILDAYNVEYRIFETWLPYAEKKDLEEVTRRLHDMKEWELRCFAWHDAAFSVSEQEVSLIEKAGVPSVCYVPTGGGMDLEKYCPKEGDTERPYNLLYIESMNWYPNYHGLRWFIKEVLPLIVETHPDVVLHIVGNGIPDLDLMSMCKRSSNLRFWGFQEDDIGFFHHSKVFVVPLWIGAGARVKVPTAWAAGIPVVSTTFGAEGAPVRPGENIMLADDPKSFADDVVGLLDDDGARKRISDCALETAAEHYSLDRCAGIIADFYEKTAAVRNY